MLADGASLCLAISLWLGWHLFFFFEPITWAVINAIGIYLQLLSSFLCLFYCSMFCLAAMSLPLCCGANSWPSAVVGLACHYPLNAGVVLPIIQDYSKQHGALLIEMHLICCCFVLAYVFFTILVQLGFFLLDVWGMGLLIFLDWLL